MKVPRILIIAGSDSGGGAGIQADIKTVTMLGGHAMTAITAITAQNTLGVTAVHPIPTEMVIAQMDAVLSDIGVDAVKIGMIGSAETAQAVADRLSGLDVPIVFDPVMVATSGSVLADDATIAVFERLMRMATLVTPNVPELETLSGLSARTELDGEIAAGELADRYGCAVLGKGGDRAPEFGSRLLSADGTPGRDQIFDCLQLPEGHPDGQTYHWHDDRIETRHAHGTGCTLASAIATQLGRGSRLPEAIKTARFFVRSAMLAAPGFGSGHGPMGHWAAATGRLDLNQVTLPARDYDEAVDFYTRLGLIPIVAAPAKGYARFECPGGATLSIHVCERPVVGDTILYFEHGALDGWVSALEQAGLSFDQQPRDESWGWREARVKDPTGNQLCLYRAADMRRFPPWRID